MNYPNLKAEVARNGITQSDIAGAAGVSIKTVYNWLSADGCPDIEQAKAIQGSLFPALSIDYLFATVSE